MSKKLISFCLALLMILLSFNFSIKDADAAVQSTFYVSPTGSGTSCTLSNPCSLQEAQTQVRAVNQNMNGDIVVYFLDGTYQLSSTFQLNENATTHDSGTNGFNIIYRAYPGAQPVISGGTTLSNWSLAQNSSTIYRSYVGQSSGVLQMYVNGQRATIARGESNPISFSIIKTPLLVIDALKVYNNSNVTTVNDNDPNITYTGFWSYDSNRTAAGFSDNNNDIHYSKFNDDSISYTFTGTGIELVTETDPGYSTNVQVYIDGTLDQTISETSTTKSSNQTKYIKTGLANDIHIITITNKSYNVLTTNAKYTNMASWKNLSQIRVSSQYEWVFAQCNISSVSGGQITFQEPCWNNAWRDKNKVSWLENAFELLDTPGEYYYDITDGYMYYMPRSQEDINTASVIIPQVEQLVSGTGSTGAPLHNVQFIGLAFQHGTWLQPLTNKGFTGVQAMEYCVTYNCTQTGKIGGNLNFNHANNIVIQGNTFSRLGGTAVVFENASQNNEVVGNNFVDISGGGIHIGDVNDDYMNTDPAQQTLNNSVRNNYMTTIGAQYPGSVAIFGGYTTNLQVLHNELDNLPYSGISLGWGWGHESTVPYSNSNVVSYNKVTNYMQRMVDGGGIYTISNQPNSVISHNYLTGQTNNFAAIYLDEATNNFNVNNNVVQKYVPNWLQVQQYGIPAQNNIVTNNYTDSTSVAGLPNSNGNSLSNTTTVTGSNWPTAAVSIMNNAGLEPGYQYLKNTAGVMVNDTDSEISYTGSWTYDKNRITTGAYNYINDAHYTSTSGNYLQYTFTGTGIDIVAETSSDFTSNALVYLDGVLQQTISENNNNHLSGQSVYSLTGMSYGSHTIKIVNNASQVLLVDGFRLYGTIPLNPVAVAGISMGQSQVAVGRGSIYDLKPAVTITPSNATNLKLIWSSSSPSVATVANGVVQGISTGQAVITVTTKDGSYSATCNVNVISNNSLTSNKPTTSSSSLDTGSLATKATDGFTTTKWVSEFGETSWLQVDLGQSYPITGYVVQHAGAYETWGMESLNTRDFKFQVSDDLVNWTDADTVIGNTANVTEHNVSATGRYVRLYITSPQTEITNRAARIYEFMVNGMKLNFDGFETGLGNWTSIKGTPTLSSTVTHSGSMSYIIDEDTDAIQQTFDSSYNKIVSIWFYDDASNLNMMNAAVVDDGITTSSLGVNTSTGFTAKSYYVRSIGNTRTVVNVKRTTGWHEFKFDYSSGTKLDMYIDGVKVGSQTGVTSFKRIVLGDVTEGNGIQGTTYYDDVNIFDLDNTVPTTSDNAPSGWVNSDATVTFTSSDSGSGVADTFYTVDGGTQQKGTSVTIKEGGSHIISYWSVDKAGNIETPHTAAVQIDKTAPTTLDNAPSGWVNSDATVTFISSDSGSGVADTFYTIDGGTEQEGTSVTIKAEGSHTISYWSVDNAGNVEDAKTIGFNLDATAPTITVTGLVNSTYSDEQVITPIIALSDNLSEVDNSKTTVTLDTYGVQQGATIDLYTLPLGWHTFTVTSSDLVGNVSNTLVEFETTASIQSLQALVTYFANMQWIDRAGIANSLQSKLAANKLGDFVSDVQAFINEVQSQSGKHISSEAAKYLLRDAEYVLSHLSH